MSYDTSGTNYTTHVTVTVNLWQNSLQDKYNIIITPCIIFRIFMKRKKTAKKSCQNGSKSIICNFHNCMSEPSNKSAHKLSFYKCSKQIWSPESVTTHIFAEEAGSWNGIWIAGLITICRGKKQLAGRLRTCYTVASCDSLCGAGLMTHSEMRLRSSRGFCY